MRVGIGYDIHRFDGRGPLKLGGVSIPYSKGLAGHSDADVLLHAITDALLGAIGAPDIGELFPPRDPRYRRAESRLFIQHASARIRRAGWRIGNIDATVIADEPMMSPYKDRMRRAISALLKIDASRVSVKAKTSEGISPGKQGIAAHAVVLLNRASRRTARRHRTARS